MNNSDKIESIEIQKAKEGNQIAFKFLLDKYWQYVYFFQLKKIANENDAEDITIQTFSKAFDKINTFNENYEFKTWLIAISKNVHIDHLRKKSKNITTTVDNNDKTKVFEVLDDTPTAEDKIIKEQNLEKLLRDIKKLKPKYQEVIHLRFFQELSYKEIALTTNEPINNIKVKLLRAKKLLSEIIKKV